MRKTRLLQKIPVKLFHYAYIDSRVSATLNFDPAVVEEPIDGRLRFGPPEGHVQQIWPTIAGVGDVGI